MKDLQQMIDETKERRAQDKIKFDEHDDDLCMLCNAYGEDKRSLFITCFYDIKEVVPEAIDTFDVPHLKDRGYYLRICKNCRGELLGKLSNWRNEMIARREIPKDHDGHNEYELDFIHKTSTEIANREEYNTVIVENLNIKGMLKNHCLAQSIADLGLGAFYRILKYKLEERGKNYLEIGRFEPSSRMCNCGTVNKELTLADRSWTCKKCGEFHPNRDLLAAQNIKKFGLQKQNLITKTAGVAGIAC